MEETIVKQDEPVIETQTQPGEKTDPALLLKSLQEEREKRRLAEEEARVAKEEAELAKAQATPDVFSDEGLALKKQIDALANQLSKRDEQDVLQSIESKFPALKDKRSEFEQYRQDNPGMKLETASKAFLIENDLMEQPKPRKGLETPSGGGRAPVSTDLSSEEIKKIRETNSRQYIKLVKEGKIKV